MLQDVRQSVIVVGFSWQAEVTVHHGGLRLGNGHSQTCHGTGFVREKSEELKLTCGFRLVFADLDIRVSHSELPQLLPVRVILDVIVLDRTGRGGNYWCQHQHQGDNIPQHHHHHHHLLCGQIITPSTVCAVTEAGDLAAMSLS